MSTTVSTNADLDKIRAAAQQLHAAISDAAAKNGGAVKADLEAAGQKAKSVKDTVNASLNSQNEVAKKHLKEALTDLDAMQKHAAEAAKNSGKAFQTSVRQTLADARASVQKVSAAVAAMRSSQHHAGR